MYKKLEYLLEEGVRKGCFPGATLAWGKLDEKVNIIFKGFLGFSRNKNIFINEKTIYDLASLTKIFSVTILFMKAIEEKLVSLDAYPFQKYEVFQKFANFLKDFKNINIKHLLSHQSGLQAWHPFYLLKNDISYNEKKSLVLEEIFSLKKQAKVTEAVIYSDINFILLGFILEEIYNKRLNKIFSEKIITPLNLQNILYCPKNGDVVPTEDGFRIAGPLNNILAKTFGFVPRGVVHDDNARYLNGIAGHAGLFSGIYALWELTGIFYKAFKNEKNKILTKDCFNLFAKEKIALNGKKRALGFDLKENNSFLDFTCFSETSLVHTGYTGTTWLFDYEKNISVILLTNRVHPTAKNNLLFKFREELFSLF